MKSPCGYWQSLRMLCHIEQQRLTQSETSPHTTLLSLHKLMFAELAATQDTLFQWNTMSNPIFLAVFFVQLFSVTKKQVFVHVTSWIKVVHRAHISHFHYCTGEREKFASGALINTAAEPYENKELADDVYRNAASAWRQRFQHTGSNKISEVSG